MRVVQNQRTIAESYELLQSLIGAFTEKLNLDPVKNRKKIIEVCHVGKLLMLLGGEERIKQLSERPDFIVIKNGILIGLEHQIVIDPASKEREGFFENLFNIAESELVSDPDLPNFHANCYIKDNVSFQLAEKDRLISEIKTVIKHYVLTKQLLQNSLIQDMHSMPHTRKSISPNFGAWWQKDVTPKLLLESILRKEIKIQSYIENSVQGQWLLLVIGGLNSSSYELDHEFKIEISTRFDKVYLMEDFRGRLFELK